MIIAQAVYEAHIFNQVKQIETRMYCNQLSRCERKLKVRAEQSKCLPLFSVSELFCYAYSSSFRPRWLNSIHLLRHILTNAGLFQSLSFMYRILHFIGSKNARNIDIFFETYLRIGISELDNLVAAQTDNQAVLDEFHNQYCITCWTIIDFRKI